MRNEDVNFQGGVRVKGNGKRTSAAPLMYSAWAVQRPGWLGRLGSWGLLGGEDMVVIPVFLFVGDSCELDTVVKGISSRFDREVMTVRSLQKGREGGECEVMILRKY